MANANVIFKESTNGYDKEQVNLYISKLAEAYKGVYSENQVLREQKNPNSDIIAKTLMDTEILAQKIIANAHKEAARIIVRAKTNYEQIQEIIEQTAGKVQSLLTIDVSGTENGY